MRIPKTIKICGHAFKVKYQKGLIVDGKECWGVCDQDKQIIYLRTGMASSKKQEIFIHEAIHAIETINDLKFSELAVKQLAMGILSLIIDNKLNFLPNKRS